MFLYYFTLFILGLCFGSFSTVLISRWESGKGGITTGRSECPKCLHVLSAWELFPVFSWIFQGGKCKNCKTPIPLFYPGSELLMGILFSWSGWVSYSFGYSVTDGMWWLFLFWTFITGVYILYDIQYTKIPDQIMVPGILLTVIAIIAMYWNEKYFLFFDYYSYHTFHTFIFDHVSSAIFTYSFFFLQILIPGVLYFIKSRSYKNILSLFLSYFTFPIVIIYDFFSGTHKKGEDNNDEPIPAWIGGGDLRIALFIGLSLGGIHTISSLFFAYCIGSIIGVGLLLYAKIMDKKQSHEIPFGPFLALGWILSLSFYTEIIDYVDILSL